MRSRSGAILLSALLAAATGCRQLPPPTTGTSQLPLAPSWASSTPLPLPAPAGSGQPQLTTSAHGILLSWLEQAHGATTLKFSEYANGAWTPAATVATGTDWFVNWADVPSVLRLRNRTLVAHWYRNTEVRAEAYDLWMSYSRDDGKTWARPFTPHHDGTKTQHGFASLVETGNGVGVVWLDAREWQLNQDDPDGGSVMTRYAAFNDAWRQTADQTVNLRVCECCQTDAVATPDGVVAVFRDRTEQEIRNIVVARLEQGRWLPPTAIHDDRWEVTSCPVNGPAVSVHGRTLAAAWFTAKNDQGQAYVAFSQDAGRTWASPVRLDDGRALGHVDVAMLGADAALAAWVEFAGQRGRVRVTRIGSTGQRSESLELAGTGAGRVVGYPRVARHGDDLIVIWTESTGTADGDGVSQVRAARVAVKAVGGGQ